MSCAEVAGIQEKGAVDRASVYGNAFGANLPKRRLADRPVFKAMATLGVGDETTNGADCLLVYGKDDAKLAPTFARLIGGDPVYGATPRLLSAQDKYLEGEETARIDGGAVAFMELLQEQRRRLFFTLLPDEEGYPFWVLSWMWLSPKESAMPLLSISLQSGLSSSLASPKALCLAVFPTNVWKICWRSRPSYYARPSSSEARVIRARTRRWV